MKNGLYIRTGDEYIERYQQSSADLSLIGKNGSCEIMIQKIDKGSNAFVEPGDIPESMEFFYLLEGKLELNFNDQLTKIKAGDYFFTRKLSNTVQFETLEDVKLLYFSSEPVFKYLSATIRELTLLADEVEKIDKYTLGHSTRVKDLSVKIATALNLSKERIEALTFASLFHDIGKIDVPNSILLKPGKLTDAEFDIMRGHPANGIKLIEKTYYQNIAEVIHQHHERLDGSGYPRGLKGKEILLEARIIAVADTYDAITTTRPYRDALSKEYAISELVKFTGAHYDPRVVKAFIKILEQEKNDVN